MKSRDESGSKVEIRHSRYLGRYRPNFLFPIILCDVNRSVYHVVLLRLL